MVLFASHDGLFGLFFVFIAEQVKYSVYYYPF